VQSSFGIVGKKKKGEGRCPWDFVMNWGGGGALLSFRTGVDVPVG